MSRTDILAVWHDADRDASFFDEAGELAHPAGVLRVPDEMLSTAHGGAAETTETLCSFGCCNGVSSLNTCFCGGCGPSTSVCGTCLVCVD